MKSSGSPPQILLVLDEDVEHAHITHIFSKYHFTNSIVRVRRPREAVRFFAQESSAEGGEDGLPELVIFSPSETAGAQAAGAVETLRKEMKDVPLIFVGPTREEEEAVRRLALPNTYSMGRPLGFFKMLEAMQKLGMFWQVTRPAS